MNRLSAHTIRPQLAGLAALLAIAILIFAACSDAGSTDDGRVAAGETVTTVVTSDGVGGDGGVSPVSAVGPGLSIAGALASTLDGPLLVNGFVLAQGGQVLLCAVLLESFPPQCGKPSLEVQGLDLDGFEGLSSEGDVRWTDQPVQLLGAVSDGVLTVVSNVSASGASSD